LIIGLVVSVEGSHKRDWRQTITDMQTDVVMQLDRINTIKELLGVKFGFMSLPLFDAEQLNCMLFALCAE